MVMWKVAVFSPDQSLVFQERFALAAIYPEWALFYDIDAPAGQMRLVLSPVAAMQLGKDWDDCPHPQNMRLGMLAWDEQYGDAWAHFGLTRP
jgi:hypothetical protein